MTFRSITVGDLSGKDLGKNISIGNATTGIVSGVLYDFAYDTEWIAEVTFGQRNAPKVPGRTTGRVQINRWHGDDLPLDTPVTITD